MNWINKHVISGILESIGENTVNPQTQLSQLYRLRINGNWYFCKAADFAGVGSPMLGQLQPATRALAGVYNRRGRNGLTWLIAENDQILPVINVFRRAPT
jgi:hypothetical protein